MSYNPRQPRAPRGRTDGGQWISEELVRRKAAGRDAGPTSLSRAFGETNSAGELTHPLAQKLVAVTEQAAQLAPRGMDAQRRDVYGVIPGDLTAVDRLAIAQPAEFQKFHNAFAGARQELRARFGRTVRLYRAQGDAPATAADSSTGVQHKKPTLLFADKKQASRFLQGGRKLLQADVPIEHIHAVYVTPSGYREFVVKNEQRTIYAGRHRRKTAQ